MRADSKRTQGRNLRLWFITLVMFSIVGYFTYVQVSGSTFLNTTITTNPDLEDSLVGHWTFDGKDMDTGSSTQEVLDRSGEDNHGDWKDHATTTVPGRIGQAIDFDGVDDHVLIPDSNELSFGNGHNFTFAAWIKTDTCQTNNSKAIEKKGTEFIQLQCSPSDNFMRFTVRDDDFVVSSAIATTDILDNIWHHAVGVREGNDVRIYINGVLEGTDNDSLTGDWFTGDVRIGTSIDGGNRRWNGLIDDVRIYKRALSTEEVERLYELGR